MNKTIGIVGVGAIGGYLGAELYVAGNDIALYGRRPFARLTVEVDGSSLTVDAPCLHADEAAPAHWVLLAVKAHDTRSAIPTVRRLCNTDTAGVLLLQNGLAAGTETLADAVPATLVPAVVMCGAELVAPGHIIHHGSSNLQVPSEHAPAVIELFKGTGVTVTAIDDFTTALWRKLLYNAVSCPLTALTARRLDVLREPMMRQVALHLMRESISVARANGAHIPPEEAETLLDVLCQQPDSMGTSMYYDRTAGRPLEWAAITGNVCRAARRHAIPTPYNDFLMALLSALQPAESNDDAEYQAPA